MTSQKVKRRHENRGPGRSVSERRNMLSSCVGDRRDGMLATVKLETSLTALSQGRVNEAKDGREMVVTVVNGHQSCLGRWGIAIGHCLMAERVGMMQCRPWISRGSAVLSDFSLYQISRQRASHGGEPILTHDGDWAHGYVGGCLARWKSQTRC